MPVQAAVAMYRKSRRVGVVDAPHDASSGRRLALIGTIAEQNVRAAVEVSDRAYVLDSGRVVYRGSASELAGDEDRIRALAGASVESRRISDIERKRMSGGSL